MPLDNYYAFQTTLPHSKIIYLASHLFPRLSSTEDANANITILKLMGTVQQERSYSVIS